MEKEKDNQEPTTGEILRAINKLSTDMDGKFFGLQGQFDGLDSKFDGLDGKFNGLNSKFDGLQGQFNEMKEIMATKNDIEDLNKKFDAFMGKTIKVEQDKDVLVGQVADIRNRVEVLENDVKQIKPAMSLS